MTRSQVVMYIKARQRHDGNCASAWLANALLSLLSSMDLRSTKV